MLKSRNMMRAVALLLCLATWRGPLPWVHDHATDPDAAESDAQLAAHLVKYHPLDHNARQDWHVHLLLPFNRCPGDGHEEDTPAAQDPLSQFGVVFAKTPTILAGSYSCLNWQCWPGDSQPWEMDVQPLLEHRPPPRDGTFLGSLLSAAPLRAVTGVALC